MTTPGFLEASTALHGEQWRSLGEAAELADPRAARLISAMLFLGAGGAVALSFWLNPSPSGYGTHQMVFLLPCIMHTLTGIPCPFCGMTTAFAHMARGQVLAAFGCHLLGPPFFVLAILAAALGARGLLTGRWPLPAFMLSTRVGQVLIAAILGAWALNLIRHFW